MLQEAILDTKKRVVIKLMVGFAILVVIMFIALLIFRNICNRVNMNAVKEATLVFAYEGKNLYENIDSHDVELLKEIFNNKKIRRDSLSCGFSKSCCVVFDESMTFCFACDGCPIVYWVEKDRYIFLNDSDKQVLDSFLNSYGIVFPCI